MQLCQYWLLLTASSLYMFRTLSASIIRSTKNCSNSHWCMSWVGMMLSSMDVQGRLPTALCHSLFRTAKIGYDIVQWQPNLDILTGYISSRPMTCTSGCYYSF